MGSLLTLLSLLFLISHQHVIAIQVSLSQPPESRVSSRKMVTFDTNTLAVPPISRRMKMTPAQVEAMPIPVSGFSDTTGGAESQAPSPVGGDAAGDSTSEKPVDGDDGDAEAPSPDSGIDPAGDSISEEAMSADGGNAEGDGGAAPAPSPAGGSFTEDSVSEEATSFSDSDGAAEAPSLDGGGSAAEAPSSEDNGEAPADGGADEEASSPSNTAEPRSAGGGGFLFGHRLPFDFDKFPEDVHPLITNANADVQKICGKTDSPDLCVAAVAPFLDPAAHVDIQKVLEISIQVSNALAKHILTLIKKFALTPGTPGSAVTVLNGCQKSYKGAIGSYESAIAALQKHDLGKLNSSLVAVMDDCEDCEEEFKGLDFQCPITALAEKLINMTNNCMALSAAETKGGGEAAA